ncbi:GNAT superfamily N-acetyltransferase/predicted nucleic acid-binding protein [Saccharothrix ecbatanensis]|uniref:GNAT superfamily N-acetyltransferase/predicted nucleic acid-binding protein n=1 Tax=Saccharothrix ecbatanensis TaxID=1105145 RepID=A0A7W9M638_9PSEU|nr:GNAT family N-acetyltransferase [Saccharothrix ecbatanensis]MBB5808826.1 GNAT superfamily N-acetyltransferase/predicted nucleic acid-binding protein [Saccharothrix ecbatanensis]
MVLASANVVIDVVSGSDTVTIEHLVELGNKSRKTLGLLPRAAYHEAAARGHVLSARSNGELVGYALFRLPRNEVVLTHLCVAREHRRSGVAHHLVDAVSKRYPWRQGLRAKCRDDYADIQRVWRGLGFSQLGRARGRGDDNAPMTVWWRDHGHPNLFTPVDEPTVLTVAIDTNILMDLHTRKSHAQAERSQVLLAPDVADRIEKVVPHGLERDIERHPAELRRRLLDAAARYRRPHGFPSKAEQLYNTLSEAVNAKFKNHAPTQQDLGDLWQIAETAAAGVKVFLTWDERLRTTIVPLLLEMNTDPELSGLRVIDPDHLVIHLDELTDAAAYRPRVLAGSRFSTELADSDSESILLTFLDRPGGETKQDLKTRLQRLAQLPRSHSIIRDTSGTPVGCYASIMDGQVLRTPLLRIADHGDADTIARHLLWTLRLTARAEGAKVVRIDDPYLSPLAARAASHESYQHVHDAWYAWVIDTAGSGLDVSATVTSARGLANLDAAALLSPSLPADAAAQYERTWWPAKITDSALPHYAVAIQPRWSAELFGEPQTLTPRSTTLALGREHVYYRTGRPSTLKAPGRILWYLTKHPMNGQGRFIGTSLLDAIETGSPEDLYAKLAHYGVFTLDDVRKVADRQQQAQALRLSYTEMFHRPVYWDEYMKLRTHPDNPKRIQAPVRMPQATFAAIYAMGNRSENT